MSGWLRFVAVLIGWALVGRAILELNFVHPFALAVVWLVGLIWLIGWAAGSVREADYLVKIMAGMAAVPLAIVGIVILADYLVS